MANPIEGLAVIVVGRNEGNRLERCLSSIQSHAKVVYVDSGSTDESVALARRMGAQVVELDPSEPFTAARARNAGFELVRSQAHPPESVHFVDGDCEIVEGWLEVAIGELRAHPEVAAVCGRRRERFRNESIYNRLMDMEWDTPLGRVDACGGDALFRTVALAEVGGFDPTLICGEEPELCLRLRRADWSIRRLDHDMTLHDAAMKSFWQWWRRNIRGGWAYAEGAHRHGRGRERFNVHESRSVWLWGLGLPILALGLAPLARGASLWAALLAYSVLAARVTRHQLRRGVQAGDAALFGTAVAIGKIPQALGQLRYWRTRFLREPPTLIEYKKKTAE